ncbi:hypothetical protein ES703_117400 [subsurface metagenome]
MLAVLIILAGTGLGMILQVHAMVIGLTLQHRLMPTGPVLPLAMMVDLVVHPGQRRALRV